MYTTLGRTGLKVATISFGGIPIQRSHSRQIHLSHQEYVSNIWRNESRYRD